MTQEEPQRFKHFKENMKKRNELYMVHSKLSRKLKEKEVLPVHEAEEERITIKEHALQIDDLVILNLDKEVYNDFVEMQRLRDQHKIGGLISPRQRALSIAYLVSLSAKPLFTTPRKQTSLPVFQSLLLLNKASFIPENDDEDLELTEKLETITGINAKQSYQVDTTELQHKIIDLLGKPVSKQKFEQYFTQKELLLIPLLLSKLNIEMTVLSKNKFLLTYARDTTESSKNETWNYYSVLFQAQSTA